MEEKEGEGREGGGGERINKMTYKTLIVKSIYVLMQKKMRDKT